MARKNDPYLPLYVQDWLTNLKLKECSPASHGLMISLMCLMHKSDDYGKLLLRQKHKICRDKTNGNIQNFADYLSRILPWSSAEILPCLTELIEEKVIYFDGDFLVCNRMVRDCEISEKRSVAGNKGADVTNGDKPKTPKSPKKPKDFAAANQSANPEIEIDNENEFENRSNSEVSLISNRGVQGGEKTDPNFYEALCIRIIAAYGSTGRTAKKITIIRELPAAVLMVYDKMLEAGENATMMDAATWLCQAAKAQYDLDIRNQNNFRQNLETWLNERCFEVVGIAMQQPKQEIKTAAQLKIDELEAQQKRVFEQWKKEKEAKNQ